jgi:poly(3-hydroxybutyrate) depolymerase
MKSKRTTLAATLLGATACLAFNIWSNSALGQAPPAAAPPGAAPAGAAAAAPGAGQGAPRGGGGTSADPRVENRTYRLDGANIDVPYCMYKSTKVSANKPAPLVVALHGMGATPAVMCNKTAIDHAEEGGYVYVAPMGYSTTGWFGSPVINLGGARGPGAGPRGAAPGAPPSTASGAGPGAEAGVPPGAGPAVGPPPGAGPPGAPRGAASAVPSDCPAPAARGAGGPPGGGPGRGGPPRGAAPGAGPAATDTPAPSNADIQKWSEADVMNVLATMRKEFNIDPKRIYLTGHSMGGAGTLFLASKHADLWAAAAPVAPAAFMMEPTRADYLKPMQKVNLPLMIVQGDADTVVSANNTRRWVDTAKELGLKDFQYVEQHCIDHGPVITTSQKDIFEFFAKHSKK